MTLDELRQLKLAAIDASVAGRALGVDRRTVARACEAGQLPHIRVGRRLLILREPLVAMLEGRQHGGAL